MTKIQSRYTVLGLGLMWMLLSSASVLAEDKFYRLEVGVQAGGAYYMGELAPYAFTSWSETYGLQLRCKIDERWAMQFKAQRQRVINKLRAENQWSLPEGRYQNPMWHFDITGEYNFFHFGIHEYDIRMHDVTPFMFVGVGFTAYNQYAINQPGYPMLGWTSKVNKDNKTVWDYQEPGFAMYIPVGIGLKWKFAQRWQLQLAWQHQLYIVNGDGLEGEFSDEHPGLLNNSHQMNGTNILNNDVTSTFTAGFVFEFAPDKKICVHCRDNF